MCFKRVMILLISICTVLFITGCNDSGDEYGEHLEVLINEHDDSTPETAKVTTAVKTTTTEVVTTEVEKTEKPTEAKTIRTMPAVTNVKPVVTTKKPAATKAKPVVTTKAKKTTVATTTITTITETEEATTEAVRTTIDVGENYTSAMELAKMSLAEIIALTGGNYTVNVEYGYAPICYIESESVFPGMHFYTNIPDIGYECQDSEVTDPDILSKLESGQYSLDAIEVSGNGRVTNDISASMTYSECTERLGEQPCFGTTGAYISGAISALGFDYIESGIVAYFHFEIYDSDLYDANYGKEFSYEEMMERNPSLKNVVVMKEN